METVYLTPEGYEKLRKELEELQGPRRREVIQAIRVARDHGDLSENAEYDAAKEEQAKLELRIHQLHEQLTKAKIIDQNDIPEGRIAIGTRAYLRNLDTAEEIQYILVAPAESDFEIGRISVTSPIGKGLIGKTVGAILEIRIPAGLKRLEVLKVERI